jgi:hypothetical protein
MRACRRRDRPNEANSRISQFCERSYKLILGLTYFIQPVNKFPTFYTLQTFAGKSPFRTTTNNISLNNIFPRTSLHKRSVLNFEILQPNRLYRKPDRSPSSKRKPHPRMGHEIPDRGTTPLFLEPHD